MKPANWISGLVLGALACSQPQPETAADQQVDRAALGTIPQARQQLAAVPQPALEQFESVSADALVSWMRQVIPALTEIDASYVRDIRGASGARANALAAQRALLWLEYFKLQEKLAVQTLSNEDRGRPRFKAGFIVGSRDERKESVPAELEAAWQQCTSTATTQAQQAWCSAIRADVMDYDEAHAHWLWKCRQTGEVAAARAPVVPRVAEVGGVLQVTCPEGEQLSCETQEPTKLMRSCLASDLYKARWLANWGDTLDTKSELELLQRATQLEPGDGELLNSLAWVLATTKDDALRDGQAALPYVTYALEVNPDFEAFIDTAAAVYAELGDFERAVQLQTVAVEKAPASLRADYERALELYEQGKPFRE
jgi:tetratricopeptide (TPR) repeat protein